MIVMVEMLIWYVGNVQIYHICGLQKHSMPTVHGDGAVWKMLDIKTEHNLLKVSDFGSNQQWGSEIF